MPGLPLLRRVRQLSATVLLPLLCGCAQVGSPTGGPQDETPPRLTGSAPADSAVNVDTRTDVVLRFSERMRKESVERALFISPYPDPYPLIRWRDGDRTLRIRFDEPLDEDRTYVITVGTDATDAHGVRLASASTIAFAAGPHIDAGEIRGSVWRAERGALVPAVGAAVGLYLVGAVADTAPSASERDPNPVDRHAAYQSQTGDDGAFAFAYLAPGTYRALAWTDRDNDDLLSPGELVAVPDRDVQLGQAQAASIPPMRLAPWDTEAPELFVIRALDRNHIEMRFGEPVLSDSVYLAVVTPDTLPVQVIAQPAASSTLVAHTGQQAAATSYGVVMRAVDPAGNAAEWAPDTTLFDASAAADTTRPTVVQTVLPVPLVAGRIPSLSLWLDDVLGPVALDSLHVWRDSVRVDGRWRQDGPNRLDFVPASDLPPGRQVWRIPTRAVADLSGNRGRDTVEVVLERVPPDSLGHLTGVVTDADTTAQGPIVIAARPLARAWAVHTTIPQPGTWDLPELPAGAYRLTAWRDSDGDGAWSAGRVAPFRPAERWVLSDTVQVRARWTSAGTTLELP